MPVPASAALATLCLKAVHEDTGQTQRYGKAHHTGRAKPGNQRCKQWRAGGGAQIAQLRHRPRRQRPLSLARVQLRDRRKGRALHNPQRRRQQQVL